MREPARAVSVIPVIQARLFGKWFAFLDKYSGHDDGPDSLSSSATRALDFLNKTHCPFGALVLESSVQMRIAFDALLGLFDNKQHAIRW